MRAARSMLGWRGGSPSGWILAIARNVHIDHARRARRVVEWDDALLDGKSGHDAGWRGSNDPADLLDDERVRVVLGGLPIATRRLLELVYLDEFTPGEVAAMTATAPGTVRMSLMRAREAFRVAWNASNDQDDA